MTGRRCPYCGEPFGHVGAPGHLASTRDHVRPRAWGSRDSREADVTSPRDFVSNVRRVCRGCNHNRALAGHCVGALACARAVAASEERSFPLRPDLATRRVLVRWRLPEPPVRRHRALSVLARHPDHLHLAMASRRQGAHASGDVVRVRLEGDGRVFAFVRREDRDDFVGLARGAVALSSPADVLEPKGTRP